MAVLILLVKTEAERPYGVPLAIEMASSSVSKGVIVTTGPKISSFTKKESVVMIIKEGNGKMDLIDATVGG